MHAAASINDSLPPSAPPRARHRAGTRSRVPRRPPQSGRSGKSKAWPGARTLFICPVTLCLHTLPACLPACLPAAAPHLQSCKLLRLLCSPAAARPRSPQERLASLIAVLADEASARSGSHYSHPTLPRPTLPDQIYRGRAARNTTLLHLTVARPR